METRSLKHSLQNNKLIDENQQNLLTKVLMVLYFNFV